MTCWATLRHNAAEAAIVGARDERVWARDGAHGSAVRLERRRDCLRSKLRLCRSSGGGPLPCRSPRRDLGLIAFCSRDYAGIVPPRLLPPCGGGPRRGVAPSYATRERR